MMLRIFQTVYITPLINQFYLFLLILFSHNGTERQSIKLFHLCSCAILVVKTTIVFGLFAYGYCYRKSFKLLARIYFMLP